MELLAVFGHIERQREGERERENDSNALTM